MSCPPPRPLTATHARRAAALAAITAVLVLLACVVLSWWTLDRFTSEHTMSGDDVVTLAFAVIAALALARLGAICLLSSRDLWGQARTDDRRPAPADGIGHLSANAASAGEHRSAAGSRSTSRLRAASVFLAIAAFSGIGASSAGAATLPTSTSSTQTLPGTDASSPAPVTLQDASATPPTATPAAEVPSPDFAAPSEAAPSALSDAPSPDASSSDTPSSDAQPSPSTQSLQTQLPSAESTVTSPTASAPASSSPAASPQVESSPVTVPSFTAAATLAAAGPAAEPASPLVGTSCTDQTTSGEETAFSSSPTDGSSPASETSAAPEPGWTPPPPAPDRTLCRLVTSGSVSFNSTNTAVPSTHVVLRGDTLWSIAASRLPADAPAEDIAAAVNAWIDANPSLAQHPDLLSPGNILQAPAHSATSAMPQAPSQADSGVQR